MNAIPQSKTPQAGDTRNIRSIVTVVVRRAIVLIIGLLFLFPLYTALTTSLDTAAHVFVFPPHLLLDWDWQPYVRVWNMAPWAMYFSNTLFISLTTVAIALITTILAAYGLSNFHFRGRETLFFLILLVLMIPGEALLIPNYVILHWLSLLNTYWAQILPFGASVFGIFLLRQFFLSLPKDYWEAARLDGASHLWYLWRIAVPLARPVLITIGLYIFIVSWNSFQWPLIVTTSRHVQPIEVAVSNLMSAHSSDWRRLSAAGIMATIPLVVIFLFLQKYILRGITRGEGVQ